MGFLYTEDTLRDLPKNYKLGTINGQNVYPCSYKERFVHPCLDYNTLLCLYDNNNILVRRGDDFSFRKVGRLFPDGGVDFFGSQEIYISPGAKKGAEKKTQSAKKVEVKETVKEKELPQVSSLSCDGILKELDEIFAEVTKDFDFGVKVDF
jgi:hypothetical protein